MDRYSSSQSPYQPSAGHVYLDFLTLHGLKLGIIERSTAHDLSTRPLSAAELQDHHGRRAFLEQLTIDGRAVFPLSVQDPPAPGDPGRQLGWEDERQGRWGFEMAEQQRRMARMGLARGDAVTRGGMLETRPELEMSECVGTRAGGPKGEVEGQVPVGTTQLTCQRWKDWVDGTAEERRTRQKCEEWRQQCQGPNAEQPFFRRGGRPERATRQRQQLNVHLPPAKPSSLHPGPSRIPDAQSAILSIAHTHRSAASDLALSLAFQNMAYRGFNCQSKEAQERKQLQHQQQYQKEQQQEEQKQKQQQYQKQHQKQQQQQQQRETATSVPKSEPSNTEPVAQSRVATEIPVEKKYGVEAMDETHLDRAEHWRGVWRGVREEQHEQRITGLAALAQACASSQYEPYYPTPVTTSGPPTKVQHEQRTQGLGTVPQVYASSQYEPCYPTPVTSSRPPTKVQPIVTSADRAVEIPVEKKVGAEQSEGMTIDSVEYGQGVEHWRSVLKKEEHEQRTQGLETLAQACASGQSVPSKPDSRPPTTAQPAVASADREKSKEGSIACASSQSVPSHPTAVPDSRPPTKVQPIVFRADRDRSKDGIVAWLRVGGEESTLAATSGGVYKVDSESLNRASEMAKRWTQLPLRFVDPSALAGCKIGAGKRALAGRVREGDIVSSGDSAAGTDDAARISAHAAESPKTPEDAAESPDEGIREWEAVEGCGVDGEWCYVKSVGEGSESGEDGWVDATGEEEVV